MSNAPTTVSEYDAITKTVQHLRPKWLIENGR